MVKPSRGLVDSSCRGCRYYHHYLDFQSELVRYCSLYPDTGVHLIKAGKGCTQREKRQPRGEVLKSISSRWYRLEQLKKEAASNVCGTEEPVEEPP